MLAVLVLLGGVGAAYAPVPTFAAVAATFVLGLWSFARGRRPSFAGPGVAVNTEGEGKPRSTLTTKLVSGYLLVWWLALIAPIAAYSSRGSGDVAQAAAQGSLRNQVLIASFGLVGSLFLPAAIKRFDAAFRWVAVLWVLYLGWAFVSLAWSAYPPLTLRSVVAFVLVSVGSFGLGAGFYGSLPNGRDLLLRHVFAAGVLSALVVLVPLPLRWEKYDLLDPSWRLAIGGDFPTYVVRPVLCALLILVATPILGVRRWRNRDWFWVAFFVLPLLALKSRGPVLWAVLALGIFYLIRGVRVQDRMLQAGMLLVFGFGACVVYYAEGAFASLVPYLTRGLDVDKAAALTGRVRLWEVLLPEVGQRPWLGAGFAAFWNPDNRYRIEQLAGRTKQAAHNGFLEELLNTGVVGLAVLMAFLLCAMVVVIGRARRGEPFGWLAFLFLIFYLLLNLTNSLVQDYLQIPFVVILATLGLMASKPVTDPPTLREAPGGARRDVTHSG